MRQEECFDLAQSIHVRLGRLNGDPGGWAGARVTLVGAPNQLLVLKPSMGGVTRLIGKAIILVSG